LCLCTRSQPKEIFIVGEKCKKIQICPPKKFSFPLLENIMNILFSPETFRFPSESLKRELAGFGNVRQDIYQQQTIDIKIEKEEGAPSPSSVYRLCFRMCCCERL
jgi:hypothetical protein